METIAVYWEPVIRVYGFDIRKSVTLIEFDFPNTDAAYWGETVESLAHSDVPFLMLVMQLIDASTTRLILAVDQPHAAFCQGILQEQCNDRHTATLHFHETVDILFFHGPHFQDRYGIAEAVFRNIDHNQLTIHTIGCTGTSVYIVTEMGKAEIAKTMLASDFIVPGH